MKATWIRLLLASLVIAAAVAMVSGIPVRWIWSSPGGSAYGIGYPMVYRFQYCGGYAPCYWAAFSYLYFIEDMAFWFVIAAAILIAARRPSGSKRRRNR